MINIITLKHGTLYDHEYVNRMYNMVQRNLSLPHNFYCLTEDYTNINPNVKIIDLPKMPFKKSWWYKTYIFKQHLFPPGTNFYIDLDMVIIGNIDCYFTHPGEFVGLRELLKVKQHHKDIQKLGSAIMRWNNDKYYQIWENIQANPKIAESYPGDQEYINDCVVDDLTFFPDEWCDSYKWEFLLWGVKPLANIIVFHGKPKPHEVVDDIITRHWR